jgi:hypothetical protein
MSGIEPLEASSVPVGKMAIDPVTIDRRFIGHQQRLRVPKCPFPSLAIGRFEGEGAPFCLKIDAKEYGRA